MREPASGQGDDVAASHFGALSGIGKRAHPLPELLVVGRQNLIANPAG
jgi:hypothetical protein